MRDQELDASINASLRHVFNYCYGAYFSKLTESFLKKLCREVGQPEERYFELKNIIETEIVIGHYTAPR